MIIITNWRVGYFPSVFKYIASGHRVPLIWFNGEFSQMIYLLDLIV